uniref:Uncharacterized protein n=1 Tax=Arion vulgaris TaxID=1028688 RepID=A0A0B7BUP3_9EUPU
MDNERCEQKPATDIGIKIFKKGYLGNEKRLVDHIITGGKTTSDLFETLSDVMTSRSIHPEHSICYIVTN